MKQPFSVRLTIDVVPAPGRPGQMMSTTELSSNDEETSAKITSDQTFCYSATIAALTLACVAVAQRMDIDLRVPTKEVIEKMYSEMKRLSANGAVKSGPSPKDN